MLWLGDFNRHHPLWELDRNCHLNSTKENIQPLLDLIQNHNMEQILPPDTPTFETAANNWTRPDNVWLSHHALNLVITCATDPHIRPIHTDHLPIFTVIDMPVARAPPEPPPIFITLTLLNLINVYRFDFNNPLQPNTSKPNVNSTPK